MTTIRTRGPKRIPDDHSDQGAQADPSSPLRPNGRAWGTAFGTASGPARRVHGAPIAASTIFVTDGIWPRQIEPRPTWRTTSGARHLVTAFRATRDGHASRRSSTL